MFDGKVSYFWHPETAVVTIDGARNSQLAAEAIATRAYEPHLQPLQEQALQSVQRHNSDLWDKPLAVSARRGEELDLVKAGLHAMRLQNYEDQSLAVTMRNRRINRLLSQIVSAVELG